MTQQQVLASTVEYNKIHALARARKLVMDKYGNDLLHFWPLADNNVFIRDLLRHKMLVGEGVSVEATGRLYPSPLLGGSTAPNFRY